MYGRNIIQSLWRKNSCSQAKLVLDMLDLSSLSYEGSFQSILLATHPMEVVFCRILFRNVDRASSACGSNGKASWPGVAERGNGRRRGWGVGGVGVWWEGIRTAPR
jgi:hypothetical protein